MSSSTRHEKGKGRILITDAHWNKTVAAIRSLGSKGFSITAGESTRLAAGFFSRHVSQRLTYPSPLAHPEAFINTIIKEFKKKQYDVLLPMELSTLLLLSANRKQFEHLVRFPFVDHDILLRAAGKKETLQVAENQGIPQPKTVIIDETSSKEALLKDPGLPLVLKPDLAKAGGVFIMLKVRKSLKRLFVKFHNRIKDTWPRN